MEEIDYRKIENEALDILDRHHIDEPVVNAVEIAEKIGISVKEIKMPSNYADVAGFYDESKKTIFVEETDKSGRKLFTTAHELGHIFLKHENYNVLFRVPKDGASYTRSEKEANCFAANLLMPKFMLREYLKKYDLTQNDYVEMSKIFGVPIVSMKRQLERLV